eukprot:scaffold22503_cov52-Phaeocystis_antarctica.AAC.2
MLRLERQPMVPEWLRNLFSPPEGEGGQVTQPATTVAMLSRPHGRNGIVVCEVSSKYRTAVTARSRARRGRLLTAVRVRVRAQVGPLVDSAKGRGESRVARVRPTPCLVQHRRGRTLTLTLTLTLQAGTHPPLSREMLFYVTDLVPG